ncbi:MAG: oligoendopeptidase F [Veillonellaceae bacterium]|nr:oligoendopeptidase F [Veillonellaceae bacterium]
MRKNQSPFVALLVGAMLFSCAGAESAAAATLPARNEIPVDSRWKLEDIYPSDDAWQADFDRLKPLAARISSYQGKLDQSAAMLLECLSLRDELGVTSGKVFAYARMRRDEDTANSHYQALTSRTESLLAEVGAATAFIEPEILAMPAEKLAGLRQSEPKLAPYGFYFENLLRQKNHILSPAEEALLSKMAEVGQSPENIFTMLARADMKFPEIKDENGRPAQLSEGRYRTYIMSPDRNVRREAFEKLFATYSQYRNTFAATLGGTVKKNIFYAGVRKYDSAIAAALESDNVPVAVYDRLVDTVNENLAPLHRYVALKKKALKLDEMHMYDLYTPLVPDAHIKMNYEEARALVQQGLHPLGAEYGKILDQALSSRWVDIYENQGKQSGAYSWGVYGVHPFVLLNFNHRLEDAMTLAHELGHSLHSYYSNSTQPYATHDYTIFSAEVASTTNETLLLDHLLKTTTDPKKKMYLLNEYLESIRTTVFRQAMFAEFERDLYARAEKGEAITADMLDAMWHSLNVKYYGPQMIVDKEVNAEWSRIPHFYYNFYVYQYVTGFSAANALASQILTEGEPARSRYLNFLKSGGSDYSLELLKKAGVDMSSPEPIRITIQRFEKLLGELETLLAQ